MKKIFVLLLACALLMGLCAIPAAATAPVFTATPDTTTGVANDVITVTIEAENVEDLDITSMAIDYGSSEHYTAVTTGKKTSKTRWSGDLEGTVADVDAANHKAVFALDPSKGQAVYDGEIFILIIKLADAEGFNLTINFVGKSGTTEIWNEDLVVAINGGAAGGTEPEIEGATVIFNETFESRYVVNAEDVAGKEVSFTINGTAAAAATVTIDGVSYVTALTPAVKPGAINTEFTVVLTVDGEVKDTWTNSIEASLKAAAADTTNPTLQNAAIATLAFCQQAAIVNKVDGVSYTTGSVADYTGYTAISPHSSGADGAVKIAGTSLYLKEGVFLNFYVDPQGTEYDASMKLSVNGVEYSRDKVNGGYWVYSVPVELADMDDNLVATMVGVTSNSYTNSVVAYAMDLYDDGETELAQAIMNYVYYAQAATASVSGK